LELVNKELEVVMAPYCKLELITVKITYKHSYIYCLAERINDVGNSSPNRYEGVWNGFSNL